jgi:2-hydroxychromene-2-carboxylate isomerase
MGELILLDAARARGRSAPGSVAGAARGSFSAPAAGPTAGASSAASGFAGLIREFYFDLACPFSYLAAERVERLLGQVTWIPVPAAPICGWAAPADELLVRAELRARDLRLPLSSPEFSKEGFPSAMRVAAYADEQRACGRFALAGLRLAFCGGYDLEEPEIMAEAAAAAGLSFEPCLGASVEPDWDEPLLVAAGRLEAAGIRQLPAFRIGDRWFEGEQALLEAAASLRHGMALSARVPA